MPVDTRKGKRLLGSPGLQLSVETKLLTSKNVLLNESPLSSLSFGRLTSASQNLELSNNLLLRPVRLKSESSATKLKRFYKRDDGTSMEAGKEKRLPEGNRKEDILKVCDWLKEPETVEMTPISEELNLALIPSKQPHQDLPELSDRCAAARTSCRAAKVALVQIVASSLVNERSLKTEENKLELQNVIGDLRIHDPEFILKAALYCRRELNIRMTANLLVAIACHNEACRPFVDKYFREVIRLPSDWLEVACLFKGIPGSATYNPAFPKVLRKNLVIKFTDFDEYQLAKYNKRKRKPARGKPNASSHFQKRGPERHGQLSLKQMIRTLHIHQPTFHVMCILGKPYPASVTEFRQAGLEGNWDPKLAGRRMKLPTPLTWETELSSRGNTADSWELLIKSEKLPYMAMLRNLRNIIKAGVNTETHEAVLRQLTNKRAVISSKQFPFRFFTAFVVLDELERAFRFNNYLQRIVRNPPKKTNSKASKMSRKIKDGKSVRPMNYTLEILKKYREALSTAIDLSIQNNLPPIHGSTLIVCTKTPCAVKRLRASGLGKSLRTVGLLLGLMCASKCESYSMYISDQAPASRLEPSFASLQNYMSIADRFPRRYWDVLACVQEIFKVSKKVKTVKLTALIQDFYAMKQRFDTVLVLGPLHAELLEYVRNCREHYGPVNAVWGNLDGSPYRGEPNGAPKDWVMVKGPTDIVLRYIAETSDNGLLEHIERIDELYGLEKTPRIHFVRQALTDPSFTETEVQIERPISDWRCCRVFISSTFRDMHAERDLLCGLVIPNIRQFAARELRVHVNEVDLRWGVPEPATRSSQSLQMCLEQAYSADIFILLVGERYGWVPKSALVNSLPKPILRQLNKFYTPGMSITEMEYRLAKRSAEQHVPVHVRRNYPNRAHEAVTQRIHAFIRAADSLNAVPSLHKLDFEEQHLEKAKRLTAFKELLRKDGVVVLESYPAWFNGVIAHRPVMGNLTELGLKLSQCLYDSLCRMYKATIPASLADRSYELPRSQPVDASFLRVFVEPVASAIAPRQLLQLEKAFLELNSRGKQCRTVRLLAAQKISPNPNDRSDAPILSKFSMSDGAVLLVTGSAGCGKTTHLAALSMSLNTTKWCPRQSTGHAAFEMVDPRAKLLSSQTTRSGTFPFESQRPKLERFIVLPQFVDGLPSTGLAPKMRIADILDCWNELLLADVEAAATRSGCLTKQVDQIKDSTELEASSFASSTSSPDALLRFKMLRFAELLKIVGSFVGTRYAFLLDAADHLQPTLFDWLPDVLPENVRFVISCHSDSVAARKLAARPDCLALSIGGLTTAERSAAVRALFGQYGKVLRESTFGNQLSVLVNKRNAEIPLYLRLACDELRLYGTYEELDSQLRALPDTVPKLVQHMIARVETECGSSLTSAALAFMCCSQKPLATDELHVLIDSWLLATRSDPASAKCTPVEDPWYALETDLPPTTGSIADLISREREVESLLNSAASDRSRKVSLPHLAFYTLLSGLRPLLAGMDDESQNDEDEEDADRVLVAPKGWLRFRSQEIKNHVRNIVLVNKGGSLPAYSQLGFHQTSRTLARSHTSKRAKVSGFPDMTATTNGKINEEFIHWLLATRLPDLEYKIYHLFHAGKFHIVCRLLTSAIFLTAKFRAGLRSSLLEDFQIQATASVDVQERWMKVCQNDAVKVRLDAIRIFVGIHNSVLSRYPFLFGELAINYEVEKSVQQLGIAYLTMTNKSGLSSSEAPSVRLFIRHSCISDAPVLPVKVSSPSGADTLTAVAVSPNSSLVVYGDQSGMITVAELGSFRELRSLFGHRGAVCSLCFLTTDTTTSSIMSFNRSGSQYQLASTAQDGSIYLWHLETDSSKSGRLQLSDGSRIASLTGIHRCSVTSVVWHPERQLLATGGLDCLVVIWTLSQAEMGSFQGVSGGQSSLPPHRVFGTRFSPINCLAFRLPTGTLIAQSTERDSLDVLAAGCWDGSVHIYDLCRLRKVRVFSASNFAISAMAYSPNGGHLLATQDVRGQLFLWNSARYTLLSGFTQVITNPRLCLESGFPDSVNCQHGQLCFTRPDGRYLIQSGNASLQNGYLSVWNAQLGLTICPWRKLDDSLRPSVTAFTVDPYNHLLVTGSSLGAVSLVCSRTARVIHTAHDLRPGERSRVQCIACHAVSSHWVTGPTFLVIIGLSNGMVQTYQFTVKLPRCERQSGSYNGSTYCSCTLVDCRSLRKDDCHSTGNCENLVAHGGGTLCVAIDDKITVSGGGNAVCHAVVYEYSRKQLFVDPHYLHGIDDAVTAVATRNHCVAVASKNRTLRIYRLADDVFSILVCIPHAANDWITSLTWSDIGCVRNSYSTFLVVGSNDGMVYTYRIYREKGHRRIQSIGGPGGPITSLSSKGQFIACGSMEGLVRLWRINRSKRLEPLTTLDSTHIGSGDQGPTGTSTTVVLFNEEHVAPPTSDEDVESTKDDTEQLSDPQPTENSETDVEQYKESTHVEDDNDVECGLATLFSRPSAKSDAISVEMKDATNTVSTLKEHESTTNAEPAESDSELSSIYHGTSDESETETPTSSESDELPRPNTPCLMSVGMNVGATVSDTFDATNLRLVIGLETILPSGGSKSSVGPYHYRIVAPFLPERLALAQGHSGVSATGLAALDTSNDEPAACFISVAKKQHTNQIAADIRHWCLPIPQDCPATVAEHTGAVTCMSRFWSTNPVGWCASGGEDGRVVFRRSVQKTITTRCDPSPLELVNLLQNSSWLVAFSISFFYDPIQPVVPISSLYIVSVPQAHFVYVAAGKMVWLLIIPDSMMSVLETTSSCTVNDLEELTNPDSRCADRIRVLSLSFSDAIIELCPLLEPTSPSSDFFYLLASFGNASLMQLIHNNSFPSFDSQNGPDLSSLELPSSACWATSWHPFGMTSAVGLVSNTPIIVSKHEGKLTLQQLWPDAKLDSLGNIKYIEPVGDLPINGQRECYLVVALSHEVYTTYLIDRQCAVLAKSEPVLPPMTVTAICILRDANNRTSPTVDEKTLQILVATSDGILHLLELDYEQSFSVSAPVSLRQVGLYPTGNHVTNVQLLQVDPLQVLVGSQTGRVDVFSIV
ncbi:hypothetical protein CRM22_009630 [Opisthorchis felineus]|uniref:TROVE domain-containing protein n=1 Tax=Opisthorchis felineus TaxID=147828 RepID=A0A4S2L5Z9_OPIFE|nr:hypothetical protein CRM22_009630 [Opisthorchis felineus]TGZ58463.1 hypothetical protein CRM22_009630 [Opisthorchis felineus]TGZ58464.1 hypothetical protein CRM22_009630 [Opisthorchis felineus]